MASLSLAMIVKNEGETIERVLGCAQTFCDEMIVVDTGSTDDTVEKAEKMGAKIHHFKWIDDFSAARNFAFAQASCDWIIWLDGDDEITQENQKRLVHLKENGLNPSLEAVYLRYNYPPYLQWRERIIPRALFGSKLRWKDPIHEYIDGVDFYKIEYREDICIEHATPPERGILKKDRNINILRSHYQKGNRDERTLYIYALEAAIGLHKEDAEIIFDDFVQSVRNSALLYEFYIKASDFYRHFKDFYKAQEMLGRAIPHLPQRVEAYLKLGQLLMGERYDRPKDALPLLLLASQMERPRDGLLDAAFYTYAPWEALTSAYFRLEEFEKAKEAALKAIDKGSLRRAWLLQLLGMDPLSPPQPALNEDWNQWTQASINFGVPLACIYRMLEEKDFAPGAIISTIRHYKNEKNLK